MIRSSTSISSEDIKTIRKSVWKPSKTYRRLSKIEKIMKEKGLINVDSVNQELGKTFDGMKTKIDQGLWFIRKYKDHINVSKGSVKLLSLITNIDRVINIFVIDVNNCHLSETYADRAKIEYIRGNNFFEVINKINETGSMDGILILTNNEKVDMLNFYQERFFEHEDRIYKSNYASVGWTIESMIENLKLRRPIPKENITMSKSEEMKKIHIKERNELMNQIRIKREAKADIFYFDNENPENYEEKTWKGGFFDMEHTFQFESKYTIQKHETTDDTHYKVVQLTYSSDKKSLKIKVRRKNFLKTPSIEFKAIIYIASKDKYEEKLKEAKESLHIQIKNKEISQQNCDRLIKLFEMEQMTICDFLFACEYLN